jgi:hypothetical protein
MFVVGERACVVWSLDAAIDNLDAIAALDPDHFVWLAQLHAGPSLDDELRHAVALRVAYHHAMETFFALLFAAVQAPHAVFGWLGAYEVRELRELARRALDGAPFLDGVGLTSTSFDAIAALILQNLVLPDKSREAALKREFGACWARMAEDFVNDDIQAEYTAAKHGARLVSGGFGVSIGLEPAPGVRPPDSAMTNMGSSQFGSHQIRLSKVRSQSNRYVAERTSRNWRPEGLPAALQLLSASMKNVKAFVSVVTGARPDELSLWYPTQLEAFQAPWTFGTGAPVSMKFRPTVPVEGPPVVPSAAVFEQYVCPVGESPFPQ